MRWLSTKRSIIITATILAAITAASFVVWFIPQNKSSTLVVSDYKSHLESIRERHIAIINETENDFKELLSGKISPDDFITRADASSSQINSLIIEMIESRPPQEWHERYSNYGEALKSYNSYLREAVIVANKMKDGISPENLQENLLRLENLKKESESFSLKSHETKP